MPLPRASAAFTALALAAGLLTAAPAWADAIDGSWCDGDGRSMTIRGPAIVTPGGKKMLGNYSRHAFSYTVPTGEAGAGGEITMVLISDDIVHLQAGPSKPAEDGVEVWHRCQPQLSELALPPR